MKEKKNHKFVELVVSNPLMCNTLHYDQYSHLTICLNTFRFLANNSKTNLTFKTLEFDQYSSLAIRLNIFWFSANNSKTISEFLKSLCLVYRARPDESIDVPYSIKDLR